ncbi:MAG: LPS export ABC transporter periplasmic protein LptC [Alphaproteobacteria bacterium]|uniref:LPS export ABC transporter periplasmic protein LptC n=1 Tax=Candidatus Nitrobium versatile TaxID=2884831 RepID=A0A953J5S6_9BACT|nr:LPS export ABC transporter periplasmic protein LptC [Candidatus Nitrobium versatile]
MLIFYMKKALFLLASLLFVGVLAIYSYKEGDMKAKVRLGESSSMDDIRITQKKEGAVKWVLYSKKAVFVTDNEVKLTSVQIRFPEKELSLTSERGAYDIGKRNLTIEGNIKASTKDYDIIASTLLWDSSRNELLSDREVRIVGKRFFVEGGGMVATSDSAKLHNKVKAVFDEK